MEINLISKEQRVSYSYIQYLVEGASCFVNVFFVVSIYTAINPVNALSLRFYQQLLDQLNQMSVLGYRHKMTVYVDLNPAQRSSDQPSPHQTAGSENVVAFHIMFERNNHDSEWRLVPPLRFTD